VSKHFGQVISTTQWTLGSGDEQLRFADRLMGAAAAGSHQLDG